MILGPSVTHKLSLIRFTKLEEECLEIHGDQFNYDSFVFTNMRLPSTIICNICKTSFDTSMDAHINKKSGCKKCKSTKPQLTLDTIKKRVKKCHGDKYTILSSVFTGITNKLLIRCNTCKSEYLQVADSITRGIGCASCNKTGFNDNKPATLYYISVANTAFKIGITNRTIKERFGKDFSKIRVIATKHFDKGVDARLAEREIILKYRECRYLGENLLMNGNTELFYMDVLQGKL